MPSHVAFLRAVNVGGRFVRMAELRAALEAAGFTDVETHLQSGNVRVRTPMRSTAKVAAEQGLGELRRAAPDFVRTHTGHVIGGVAPLGHPAPLPTFLDRTLRAHDVLWAGAGHPAAVFSTTYDELVSMTGATEIEVR